MTESSSTTPTWEQLTFPYEGIPAPEADPETTTPATPVYDTAYLVVIRSGEVDVLTDTSNPVTVRRSATPDDIRRSATDVVEFYRALFSARVSRAVEEAERNYAQRKAPAVNRPE